MKESQYCIITGKVQGVFFRRSTLEKAQALGLTGWVKNCPEGQVACLITGEPEALALMNQWLWEGPCGAVVKDVESLAIPLELYADFKIV